MSHESGIDVSQFIRPLGILQDGKNLLFVGTGFGIQRRGLILTASHVIGSVTESAKVYLQLKNGECVPATHMEQHPDSDIAALMFEADQVPSHFELGKPPRDHPNFLLGTEVSSYGYPYRDEPGGRKTLEPRLNHGRIQRHFRHEWSNPRRHYHAFELSFPVLPGQSGSPVFLDHSINSVIAVLTTSFESSVVLDSVEEHKDGGDKEIHMISKVVSYGIGAEIWRHADWLKFL